MTNSESVVLQVGCYKENVKEIIQEIQKNIEEQYTKESLNNLGRIFIVGTGMNYAAALAARDSFHALTGWTGEWINVVSAEVYAHQLGTETLEAGKANVICLDADGDMKSSLDAVETAHKYNAHVTGITLNQKSALAAASDKVICPREACANSFGDNDHFFSVLLAALIFAIAVGEARELVTEQKAADFRLQIAEYVESFQTPVKEMEQAAKRIAKGWEKIKNYEMVGTGADYATAWLARFITYKELGVVTTVEESEDWIHVNMLQLEPEVFGCVVFVSDGNPSKDRTFRTLKIIRGIGRETILITDSQEDAKEFPEGTEIIRVPATTEYWMKPLMQFIPAMLLLAQLKELTN